MPPDPTQLDAKLGNWCAWVMSTAATCPGIAPNPGCGLTNAPSDLCPLCSEPLVAQDPAFQSAYGVVGLSLANATCSALVTDEPAPPTSAAGDPGFTAELGAWCGFWGYAGLLCPSATVTQCTWNLAYAPSCTDCAQAVGGGDPVFTSSFAAAWSATAAGSCPTLLAAGSPAAPDLAAPTFMDELGQWCGWKSGIGVACANATSPVESCSTPTSGTGSLCKVCDDAASVADPDFAFAYNQTYAAFTQGTCADMIQAGPYPAPSPPITALVQLAEWCGYWNAAKDLCLPNTVGACAFMPLEAPPCDACEAGLSGADPAFLSAYAQALSSAGGIPCDGLNALRPPPPDPNLPAVAAMTGAYCGWLAAVDDACPIDPNASEPPKLEGCDTGPWMASCDTCEAAIGNQDPDFLQSYSLALQGSTSVSCDQLNTSPPLEPSATDPTFQLALGKWCGWKVAIPQVCTDPVQIAKGCVLASP